jgi:carboxypeptidase C (cathepsin A)
LGPPCDVHTIKEQLEAVMQESMRTGDIQGDGPILDQTPYGSGKDDSISNATEIASVTHHSVVINKESISYTAHTGHLVVADQNTALPAARIFYVAFTADDAPAPDRPITFFYNGGPGSSSVFLLLGSFGPRRIKTSMPHFTPPAPYTLEDNPDSLLDQTDLVFINPVGTGYSAAIAPNKNKDFWGVDQDAGCVKQFIKRYLTAFKRWNSPKFLFGESYGTPRTCVLAWLLHEDGVDLNGIVLQSAILDYSQNGNPVGLLPTLAADAFKHGKVTLSPRPRELSAFLKKTVIPFAREQYSAIKTHYARTRTVDPKALTLLSNIIGIDPVLLKHWQLDVATGGGTAFLTSLLQDEGWAIGSYDGRVTAIDTGIAASIDPNSGGNDPTITAVGGVYTAMWNVYLNEELGYTSTSPFVDLNNEAFLNWNFEHRDPTGDQKGGRHGLYTAGDLAASMALNTCLKVFVASGYYDAVTPFFQTDLDLENMPLDDPAAWDNLTQKYYESGHMVYLDNASRTAMKKHLAEFYKIATPPPAPKPEALLTDQKTPHIIQSRFSRRFSRTPY